MCVVWGGGGDTDYSRQSSGLWLQNVSTSNCMIIPSELDGHCVYLC